MIEFVADVIREKQAEIVKVEVERDEWRNTAEAVQKVRAAMLERVARETQAKRNWRTVAIVGIVAAGAAGFVAGLLLAE